MKSILTFFALSLFLAITASFKPSPSPRVNKADETATVYIFRGGQFVGALANWSIYANGEKICKLSNNKYIKETVKPGKIIYTAKLGGMSVMKKKTEVEINAEAGKSYYIMCNVKQSITRARMEMVEVTESTAKRLMVKMDEDNCQTKIGEGSETAHK